MYVGAEEGGHNFCYKSQNVAYSYPDSAGSHIFQLQPKNFAVIFVAAVLAAGSSIGNKTSQIVNLCLQKYWQGMPAVWRNSSKASFFNPVTLLVLRSVTRGSGVLWICWFPGWAKFHYFWSIRHTCPPCLFHSPQVLFGGFSRRLILEL